MKRRALGKGLETLLPSRPQPVAGDVFLQVEMERIIPNPRQPRSDIRDQELEDLAASIREAGVLQPILVREAGESRYELIAGERRWRAAKLAGLKRIPAMVQKVQGEKLLELALIENIQREQLNPIDEAQAFAALIRDFGLTQEAVAQRVGRKRPSVANSLRLLKLPGNVQKMLREGVLASGHAKALLTLESAKEIQQAAEEMAKGAFSVRKAEKLAKARRERTEPAAVTADPNIRDAEERLQRALGTKVRIRKQGIGKGRIEIEFYSEDELQRLFEVLEGDKGWAI
jgi:ParB family chromosome partitioning protein